MKPAKLLGEAWTVVRRKRRTDTRTFRMVIVRKTVQGMWRVRLSAILLIGGHSNPEVAQAVG
jgi:hypothetical protein